MCRDDCGGRDERRSRCDNSRRCSHHWRRGNNDRRRNSPCRGATTIGVEPWKSEPAASTEPTTMPSTAASGRAMSALAADVRSVKNTRPFDHDRLLRVNGYGHEAEEDENKREFFHGDGFLSEVDEFSSFSFAAFQSYILEKGRPPLRCMGISRLILRTDNITRTDERKPSFRV